MSLPKISTAEAVARINVTDIRINGAWMPCEFVQNRVGLVKVVMLADIEFDEPASKSVWHETVDVAAAYRFDAIEACRKLALRAPLPGRSIEDCPFHQVLKRDLIERVL
jgi:hypothetical protein